MMNERQLTIAKRAFEKALSNIQRASNEHPRTTGAPVAQLVISLRLRYKGVETETACDFAIDLSKIIPKATIPEPEVLTLWDRLLKDE